MYFKLKQLDWRVAIIWECSIRDKVKLPDHINTLTTWVKSECEYIEIPGVYPPDDESL